LIEHILFGKPLHTLRLNAALRVRIMLWLGVSLANLLIWAVLIAVR
jgi:hypothetical protein